MLTMVGPTALSIIPLWKIQPNLRQAVTKQRYHKRGYIVQSGSLLYLVILLAGSNTGYGLPSVANDITSPQYFKVFYNFSFSIISRQITDHPLIIRQNKQSFLPGSRKP